MTSANLQQELQQGLTAAQNRDYLKAEAVFHRILEVYQDQVDALNLLSRVYYDTGRIEDSVACLSRMLDKIDHGLDPVIQKTSRIRRLRFEAHSNLVFNMNYVAGVPAEDVYNQHVRWAEQYARPNASYQHTNIHRSGRKLRIGYVSPDYRMHSVAFFIAPILERHDPDQFETYCYSDVQSPDSVTGWIARLASHWRPVHGKSDEDVAAQVMADEIDILVDLTGHTTNNRLLTFARKPAPVQVTYLGYPNTTGLSAMDYRITDSAADPAENDGFYSEQLVRLPGCFICYSPPLHAPDVTSLPASVNGYITLGSFNAIRKITDDVIDAWSVIMNSLPHSRLILKNPGFSDQGTCRRLLDRFAGKGISAERIELVAWVPDFTAHLGMYCRIDLALDTFPYNGTTTTCEALWMGVPVLTVTGRSHANRVGSSLLGSVGLLDCITGDVDKYCQRAVALAGNTQQLAEWRQNLRSMMCDSPLCDAKTFIKNLESAYHSMWDTCCRQSAQADWPVNDQ